MLDEKAPNCVQNDDVSLVIGSLEGKKFLFWCKGGGLQDYNRRAKLEMPIFWKLEVR